MDPLSALSLASSLVAILDICGRALRKVRGIQVSAGRQSGDDLASTVLRLRHSSRELEELVGSMQTRSAGTGAKFFEVAKEIVSVSAELQELLERLRDPRNTKWASIRTSLQLTWSKGELEQLQERLDLLRFQLQTIL